MPHLVLATAALGRAALAAMAETFTHRERNHEVMAPITTTFAQRGSRP